MLVARVSEWGLAPKLDRAEDQDTSPASPDKIHVKVVAAALHNLVRQRAAGLHPSARTLPHHPGIDGVGTTADGHPVYFLAVSGDIGSFAQQVRVPAQDIFKLPTQVDSVQTAALVNPALSSWMALRRRALPLPKAFRVLILGATSCPGRIAINIARYLGAGYIIACARDADELRKLDVDANLVLQNSISKTDFSQLGHVDVVLDYLYGPPAEQFFKTYQSNKTTQYLQIGDAASKEICLHSQYLRSRKLIAVGSGIGSVSVDEIREELPALLETLTTIGTLHLEVLPFAEMEKVWDSHDGRIVFMM